MLNFRHDGVGGIQVLGRKRIDQFEKGNHEVGNAYSTIREMAYTKSKIDRRAGDPWTMLKPWDSNLSVNEIVETRIFTPKGGSIDSAIIMANKSGSTNPIGNLFPIRGDQVTIRMGQPVYKMVVRAIDVGRNTLTFRCNLYGAADKLIGILDATPFISNDRLTSKSTSTVYYGLPSIGKPWVGEGGTGLITVTEDDELACLNGKYAHWSLDCAGCMELAMKRLSTGDA